MHAFDMLEPEWDISKVAAESFEKHLPMPWSITVPEGTLDSQGDGLRRKRREFVD